MQLTWICLTFQMIPPNIENEVVMSINLHSKTILVTGAARRLGRSAALAAASQGANVILHYNSSLTDVEETLALVKGFQVNAWVLKADLGDTSQVEQLISEASVLSPLYALINNASIFKPVNFQNTTTEDWEQHLQVNLTAPYLLTREFARNFNLPVTGRVINLVDWRALRPGRDHFPYTISKAGLVALTQAAALNLAPRIVVNAIALGAILPPENEPENENILKPVPMKRWASLKEFDETILFLLQGPEFITGEVIHLDGGRHLV